jgi:acyl carrier protein
LPGLSINWGAWSDIGAAARLGVVERAGSKGIGTITPAEGFSALERLMKEQRVQTAVVAVDWPLFSRQSGDRPPRFLSRVSTGSAVRETPSAATVQVAGLRQQLEETPPAGRLKAIAVHVRERAGRVLGAPPETVDTRRPLNEQGLDSLMAVELRNVLGALVERPLSATLLFDYPTVEAVAAHLATLLGWGQPAVEQATVEVDVLDRIDDLSDEDIDRLLAARMAGTS